MALLPQATLGYIMGIDLGTQWFKVGLVKPRLDVALNDQSSRKTPSVVAYHQDNILVGTDAKNLVRYVIG
jgi:hypoxia up-regulated 1